MSEPPQHLRLNPECHSTDLFEILYMQSMYAPSPHHAPVRNAYGSDLMQSDLSNEAATLAARQQICNELAQAEADQFAAAENLVANHNTTKSSNQRLAEAERAARHAEAEQARATKELRRREAEARATAAAAAAAAEAFDQAAAFHAQATANRDSAVSKATACMQDSRQCEANLTRAAAEEHSAAHILAHVHGEATSSQVGYAGIGNTRNYSALEYPAHPAAARGRGQVAVSIGADGVARVTL